MHDYSTYMLNLTKKWLIIMNSYFDMVSYEELLNEIKYVYQSDARPWIIGYSGGKDSTTVIARQNGYKRVFK